MTDSSRGACLTPRHLAFARPGDSSGLNEIHLDQLKSGGRHENIVLGSAICRASRNSGADEPADFYSVVLPLLGRLVCDQLDNGSPVVVGRGVVASPTQPMRLRASAHAQLAVVQIARAVIESALSRLLGRAPLWPLVFEPAIDVQTGPMNDWYRLTRGSLWRSARHGAAFVSPAVEDLLVVSLLRGQPHNYTSVLEWDQPGGQFEAVRSAVERMNRNPDSVRTVTDLADVCGVSVRSLRDGFRRYLGVTPSDHLRSVRSRAKRREQT